MLYLKYLCPQNLFASSGQPLAGILHLAKLTASLSLEICIHKTNWNYQNSCFLFPAKQGWNSEMRSASYNTQVIKKSNQLITLRQKFWNFFQSNYITNEHTYQNYILFPPWPKFVNEYSEWLFSYKVNPDLVNHILVLVTSKHYRCFSIHAHLKAGLHQAQEF